MDSYDVVVVGGGAAGLSAALTLSRARRSVVVVDAGEPRNAAAGHVHNYLGREGTPPRELLAAGRDEVTSYGGRVIAGAVTSAQRVDGGGFQVELADGATLRARRLLLTTGLIDELPDVPGVADRWGRDVLHCPYCHGWEVRDRRIGVLATGPMAVHQALLFRQWTPHLTLLLHTAPPPTAAEVDQLAARGITVVEGTVERLEVDGDRLVGVRLASGDSVQLDAVVVAPFFRARADLLAGLELEPTSMQVGEQVIATYVAADATGATATAGVYVAGNLADPRAQVIASAAGGLTAAAAINVDLVAEDTAQAVARAKDRASAPATSTAGPPEHQHGADAPGPDTVFDREFWDDRYRSSNRLWSGRPNAALVDEVAGLSPGTALEVGCGEGADAIWLAAQGWQVTAVDISLTAVQRGRSHAAEAGQQVADRITWLVNDLTAEPLPDRTFDLVTAHYLHLPGTPREAVHQLLAARVAPGGTLLVVGHHPSDVHAGVGRWSMPDAMWTAEQVADSLGAAAWDVVTVEARPRPEHGKTVRDAVLTARRR